MKLRMCAATAFLGAIIQIGFVASAAATPNFPAAIQSDLGLSYKPDCSLCHNGSPGRGNVTTAFGTSMLSRGLVARDTASLKTALSALEAEMTDSNGDGVPDIQQLRDGSNPNYGAGGGPKYGCGAHIAPRQRPGVHAILLGLLFGAAWVLRRCARR